MFYFLLGIGIDENLLISALGKWNPVERKSFRKETSQFFLKDDRHFERWDDQQVKLLKREFLRFKVIYYVYVQSLSSSHEFTKS